MHFFFLFIGRDPTTWTANNFLQTMVCSCVVPSKRVLPKIIFDCLQVKIVVWFPFVRILLSVFSHPHFVVHVFLSSFHPLSSILRLYYIILLFPLDMLHRNATFVPLKCSLSPRKVTRILGQCSGYFSVPRDLHTMHTTSKYYNLKQTKGAFVWDIPE